MPKKAPTRKLDIFRVLNHLNKKDRTFFEGLEDEEKKGFQPVVVQRWLSGIDDPRQIVFINELVNPFVFNLPNDKGLIYKLMTTCTAGHSIRYKWIKGPSKAGSSKPVSTSVIKEYFGYSSSKASDVLPLLNKDDIIMYAEELGRQKEDITSIRKEMK